MCAVGAFALVAMGSHGLRAVTQELDVTVVEVVAKRFAFEPAMIEVVEKRPVRLVVTSGDGLHGIEIKAMKVKKDVPRGGEPVVIEFTPETAGRYPILCSTYCGNGHGDMKGMLVVSAQPAP